MKPHIEALLEEDPNVRLVYREWPILGDGSVQGATVSPGSKRLQSCIGDIVESIRFPKFAAPRMGARYQFHTS